MSPSALEAELAIEKLKRHKSTGIDQISAELIKARGRTIRYGIHKLINSIWNKEELPEEWKESITVPMYRNGDKADCSNYRGISLLGNRHKILSNILLSRLTFKNRAFYTQDVRTATLQMLHSIYFLPTNISTEYFKHAAHSPFVSSKCRLFRNATFFGSCVIHILRTGCAKI